MQAWVASDQGQAMAVTRGVLPIVNIRQALLSALEAHDVVVVSGATGCGKTTQVRKGAGNGGYV